MFVFTVRFWLEMLAGLLIIVVGGTVLGELVVYIFLK